MLERLNKKEADDAAKPAMSALEMLLPAAVGGTAGGLYGAYKAPGHSRVRGALIGALGGAGAGVGMSGMNAFLQSPHAQNIENTAIRSAMVLGGAGAGLHGGLAGGRQLASHLQLGRQNDDVANDLEEIDPTMKGFQMIPSEMRSYLTSKRADDAVTLDKSVPALSHDSEVGIRALALKNNDVNPAVMQELDKLWPKSTAAKRDKTTTSLMFGKDAASLSPLPYKREHPWVLSIRNGKSSISRPPIAGKPVPGLESQPSGKSKKIKTDKPVLETKPVSEDGNVKIAAVPGGVSSFFSRLGGAVSKAPGQAMAMGRKAALPLAAAGTTAAGVHQMTPYYTGQKSLPDDIASGLGKLMQPWDQRGVRSPIYNKNVVDTKSTDYQQGRMAANRDAYGQPQPKAGGPAAARTPGSEPVSTAVPPSPVAGPTPELSANPTPPAGAPAPEQGMLGHLASAYGKLPTAAQYGIPAAAGLYALSRYMQPKEEKQPHQGYPMMPMQMPMMGGGGGGGGRMLLSGF